MPICTIYRIATGQQYPTLACDVLIVGTYLACMASRVTRNHHLLNIQRRTVERNALIIDLLPSVLKLDIELAK